MRKVLTGALALAFVGSTLAASAAQADDRRRYRGDDHTDAVIAGIAGLAIGAAIGSSSRGSRYYDGRYYDRGYYYGGSYRPGYSYGHAPYGYGYGPRYGYYDRPYAYRSRHYQRCRTTVRFDPYYGRYVERTRCR